MYYYEIWYYFIPSKIEEMTFPLKTSSAACQAAELSVPLCSRICLSSEAVQATVKHKTICFAK